MLRLKLRAIHVDDCYPATPELPPKMAQLYPEAANAITALQEHLGQRIVLSDAFRTPESSLQAMGEKRGVAPPGFSGHNFGLAVDVDVEMMLKRLSYPYIALLELMESFGWHCHRRDRARGMEDWHFNFLGADAAMLLARATKPMSWGAPVEARVVELYGPQLVLTATEAQVILARLRLYQGAPDGVVGPRTRQAISAFQRAWKLPDDGELNARTQRVLAVVGADRVLVG